MATLRVKPAVPGVMVRNPTPERFPNAISEEGELVPDSPAIRNLIHQGDLEIVAEPQPKSKAPAAKAAKPAADTTIL